MKTIFKRKALSLLLTFAMVLSLLPAASFAAEEAADPDAVTQSEAEAALLQAQETAALYSAEGAVPLAEIREELELPSRILSNLLFTLVDAGMLNEIRRDGREFEPEYAPARDISTLRVYDVLEAVDSRGAGQGAADLHRKCGQRGCSDVVERLKEAARRSPSNVKITELIDDERK